MKGHAVSKGIGIGKVLIYKQFEPKIEVSFIQDDSLLLEYNKYLEIKEKANKEIAFDCHKLKRG